MSIFDNMSVRALRVFKSRLTSELEYKDLPVQRKTEVEALLYNLNEYLRQRQNEVIHRFTGVDGWQEIYAEAPSEEDIKKEMAEGIKEDIEDEERQRREIEEFEQKIQQKKFTTNRH